MAIVRPFRRSTASSTASSPPPFALLLHPPFKLTSPTALITRNLLSLPTELLAAIFADIPSSAQASLCLVCRDFLPIARAKLYSTIHIDTVEDRSPEAPPDLSTTTQQRLSVLCSQPHLAQLVRSISIFLLGPEPNDLLQEVMERLALACPGLRFVELMAAIPRDFEGALSRVRELKTFKLIAGRWGEGILKALRAHPELTSLSLHGSDAPSPTELGEAPSFQLRSLQLYGAFDILASHLTQHLHYTLRTLQLAHPPHNFDLSSLTALRSLSLERFCKGSTEAVVQIARKSPFLDTLTLDATQQGVVFALEQVDILRRLPSSLRVLQRDLTFSSSYTLSAPRDASLLVNLEDLHLSYRASSGVAQRRIRDDEKGEIRAAARARGIEFRRGGRSW